jgi:hypothetical protein
MKRLLFTLSVILLMAASCKKDDTTTPNNNNNNNNSTGNCQDGYVCFKLDGTDISKPGGGYVLADTFLFVKYEEGEKQLSIDIFGKKTGNYNISDKRLVGNARVYYFPQNNVTYMSDKGNFNVSELTSGNKITGTFSATLYKYDSDKNTFTYTDSMVIANGSFNKIQLN